MIVTIPGRPKGKARPKFTSRGRTYTPQTTKDYEDLIAICYRTQDGRKHKSEVSLDVNAIFKIPESTSKKRKQEILSSGKRPTIKPDIDNIVKVVMDALNGIAYEDDSQVVKISASKSYDIGQECIKIEIKDAAE